MLTNSSETPDHQTFYNQEDGEEWPSPEDLLFENSGLISWRESPILSSERIKIFSGVIVAASFVICSILCGYRAKLNEWKNGQGVDKPVLQANLVVDQCLERTVILLGPISDECVKSLVSLQKSSNSLSICYLNQLEKLNHTISIIKEKLTDPSRDINDLYEWVHESLTPILDNLSLRPEHELNQNEIESERRSFQVSSLLDDQVNLCKALNSLVENLNLFKISFMELSSGLDGFTNQVKSILALDPDASESSLGFQKVFICFKSYDDSCIFFIQSLLVLSSIADVIQCGTICT